jgi:putative spermidine/putrescine transport system permease protein
MDVERSSDNRLLWSVHKVPTRTFDEAAPRTWFSRWMIAIAPASLMLLLLFILPFVHLAVDSLHPNAGLGELEPRFTIENYVRFVGDGYFLDILLETFFLGAIVVAACIILGYPVAYFLARSESRYRSFFIFLVVAPMFVSLVIRNLGWFPILGESGLINWTLKSLGLIDKSLILSNNFIGVAIGLVHAALPLLIISLTISIQRIDSDIELAANGLGATPFKAFFWVLLPLSLPGLIAGSLLVFTITISAYTTPAMLGGNRVMVMATYIRKQILDVLDYAFGATCAVILLIVASTVALISLHAQSKATARQ